jgi:hypothetical protein
MGSGCPLYRQMNAYEQNPSGFLTRLYPPDLAVLGRNAYCAGFEMQAWRCDEFAFHLASWLPDYALIESELKAGHGDWLLKLRQAAVRVYTTNRFKNRGEIGEIALHAICREFFGTIPIAPRVFYKTASNDVVKAFDLVHARIPSTGPIEIWLGESKIYRRGQIAIKSAIVSIGQHIKAGFLSREKLLIGPTIPKETIRYQEVENLFKQQTSLDELMKHAVFPIAILCDSASAVTAQQHDAAYLASIKNELEALVAHVQASGINAKLKIVLIYVPLARKLDLVKAFDKRLKGLQ